MEWFEICIVVLIAVYVLMVLACVVDFYILTWSYKKFYETTEEGRKLYCALYTLDRLRSKHEWLVNRMQDLRDEIDKITRYFPDECKEKLSLVDMKNEYKERTHELGRVQDEETYLSEKINKIVAALPKKYRDILEYNWKNAKVGIKEENVCW